MPVRSMADIVRNQDPVVLPPEASVKDACRAMRDRRVGAVLVARDDLTLLGIFTGRDAVCRVLAEGRDPAKVPLSEAMTAHPDTIVPGKSAVEALQIMSDCGFRHLPIVERGKIVGIVSHGDFRGLELARHDEHTGLWERI
ncbi:MAG: cyclic nucleotide-binding/CBS domain-containing protein [Alphaproteobacteria bacterium]